MEICISGSFVEQSNKMTALFFSLLLEKKKGKSIYKQGRFFFVGHKFPSFCMGCFHLSCTTYAMDTTHR